MDDEVEPALRCVQACYTSHLRGNDISLSPDAAPLAGLLLNERGWRPDGLAEVRRLLRRSIVAFCDAGSFAPKTPTTRDAVAAAVSKMWGLDGHPVGAAAAGRRLDLVAGERQIRNWPDVVLRDPAVLRIVDNTSRAIRSRLALPIAGGERRRAWRDDERDWPPRTWDVATQSDEFQDLAALVRGCMPCAAADGEIVDDLDAMAHEMFVDSDEFPIVVLRDAVAPLLLGWFRAAEDTEHAIWVRNNVLAAWYDDDALAPLVPRSVLLDQRVSGPRYAASVAAATQMLMWTMARDGRRLASAARTRWLAARRLAVLARALRDAPDLGSAIAQLRRSDRLAEVGLRQPDGLERALRPFVLSGQAGADVGGHLASGRTPRTAHELLDFANVIRAASDDPLKRALLGEYVAVRSEVFANARGDGDKVQLALADQSVAWDAVCTESLELARRLAHAAAAKPAGRKLGYATHMERCLAVLANKNDRWGRALADICRGLDALAELVAWDMVDDKRERESSAEQLYLAGAGIAVRRLERALTRASSSNAAPDLFAGTARAGLWFSHRALDALMFLEKDGLPVRRHVDGQIATVAWRVQTRLIRLRVLLAVRTAVEAGLVDERELRAPEQADVPLQPLEPCAEDVFLTTSASLDGIVELYRQIQHLDELTEAHVYDLVPLAAWLAFLNGGMLPTVDSPTPAIVVASALLARRKDQLGASTVPFNVPEFVAWLDMRRTDALVLSWIPLALPAAKALDRCSYGLYGEFRRQHRLDGLQMSHD